MLALRDRDAVRRASSPPRTPARTTDIAPAGSGLLSPSGIEGAVGGGGAVSGARDTEPTVEDRARKIPWFVERRVLSRCGARQT